MLGAYDREVNGLQGSVDSFSLNFTLVECSPTYHWRMIASPSSPPRRAQHAAVAVGSDLFVYGGRTVSGSLLHDAWRFDSKGKWHELNPLSPGTGAGVGLGGGMAAGRSGLLTPWGVLALGGLKDITSVLTLRGADARLEERTWLLDLWTAEWSVIPVLDPRSAFAKGSLPAFHGAVAAHVSRASGIESGRGNPSPATFEASPAVGRYLSAAVMFDGPAASCSSGATVLTFGGDDGARTFSDDLRVLSLAALVAPHRSDICGWSLTENSTAAREWASCRDRGCPFTSVLRRAWCEGNFQPIGFV